MSATASYRAAAVIFFLFAVLHTIGFLSLQPPTPQSAAVWNGMNQVHFTIKGSSYSYGEFYIGFGLSATASMLFSAFLCWELGRIARVFPAAATGIGWALCAVQVIGFALSARYFSIKPASLSALLAALLAWAAWKTQRSARGAESSAASPNYSRSAARSIGAH